MVIAYLAIRVLIFDAYNLAVSANGQYCQQLIASHSSTLCSYTLSGYNLKATADQQYLNVLDFLAFAYTIVAIIFFIAFRRHIFKMVQWLDFSEVT
jgi:hypothetical protein